MRSLSRQQYVWCDGPLFKSTVGIAKWLVHESRWTWRFYFESLLQQLSIFQLSPSDPRIPTCCPWPFPEQVICIDRYKEAAWALKHGAWLKNPPCATNGPGLTISGPQLAYRCYRARHRKKNSTRWQSGQKSSLWVCPAITAPHFIRVPRLSPRTGHDRQGYHCPTLYEIMGHNCGCYTYTSPSTMYH